MSTESAPALVPDSDWRRPLRYAWRLPWLFLHALAGIFICVAILSWNQQAVARNGREPLAHRSIRWWSRRLLKIFGFRARMLGQPLADPVFFIANHTSWLDIVLLHSQRAVCFVAKAEIAHWPLVGWMAKNGGTIFHRRGNNYSLATVMQVMERRLQQGRSVAAFPEGGCGHNGVLRVFHARIFQVALEARAPVQPVALRFASGGRRQIDAGFRQGESFSANFLRLLGSAPMDAEVHFLEPVPLTPDARRQMAERARERIAMALDDPA